MTIEIRFCAHIICLNRYTYIRTDYYYILNSSLLNKILAFFNFRENLDGIGLLTVINVNVIVPQV